MAAETEHPHGAAASDRDLHRAINHATRDRFRLQAARTLNDGLMLVGPTTLEAVRGVWSIILALTVAILVLIATNFTRLTTLNHSVGSGTEASTNPDSTPSAEEQRIVSLSGTITETLFHCGHGEQIVGRDVGQPARCEREAANGGDGHGPEEDVHEVSLT